MALLLDDDDENAVRRIVTLFGSCRERHQSAYPRSPLDFDALNLTPRIIQGRIPFARGHSSDVFKGVLDCEMKVAVKILRMPMYSPQEEHFYEFLFLRFFRELNYWSGLQHPNIAEMLGFTLAWGSLGFVSPWYCNGNLVEYLKLHPWASKYDLILDVAEGLRYLHTRYEQLIHADLKGVNIFVKANGIACLGDFGISKQTSDLIRKTGFTTSGTIKGTTPWMAPELLDDEASCTLPSDIYACAGVFLEILCPGKTPFHYITNEMKLIIAKFNGVLPDRAHYPEFDQENGLWELLVRCWGKDPYSRPDVDEVTQILYYEFGLQPRVDQSIAERPPVAEASPLSPASVTTFAPSPVMYSSPSQALFSLYGTGSAEVKPDYPQVKIVLVMVGLPARGKTHLSTKLAQYLTWLEYKVKVFNVGQLRWKKALIRRQSQSNSIDYTAGYFNPSNEKATRERSALSEESLEALISWLKEGGNVGIHVATNSTRARRAQIAARVAQESLDLLFVESLCDDPEIIAKSVRTKASDNPDYRVVMSHEEAEADYRARIRHYESIYETVEDAEWDNLKSDISRRFSLSDSQDSEAIGAPSLIKIINPGHQVELRHIGGYLQSRIGFYLMNLHLNPRSIFLCRHGESTDNVEGRIGGDAPLSHEGQRFAQTLPEFILKNIGDVPLTVWTSTMQRSVDTAKDLLYKKLEWKSLDEIDVGVCDSMTYEEIGLAHPDYLADRDEDKYNYRYRGGESYRDVVLRLEPVIMELERQDNVLIIAHQAVIRCIYAYFRNIPQAELPYINIPLHTVIRLTPNARGCEEERYQVPIQAVNTHRPKPKWMDSL